MDPLTDYSMAPVMDPFMHPFINLSWSASVTCINHPQGHSQPEDSQPNESQSNDRLDEIVCASRNPTSPHRTSVLVSSKLGQRFGAGSGVDLGGFWDGLGVVEGGWLAIGWAEG